MPDLLLGVDPGADRVGLATMQRGDLVTCFDLPLTDALDWLSAHADTFGAAVVEDTRKLPIYARYRDKAGRDRIARGVGQVDAATGLLIDWLLARGVPVLTYTPRGKSGKKWTPAVFAAAFPDWPGEPSQHALDAVRCVAGRSLRAVLADAALRHPALV
ncbi:MAG: hypothetical protein AAGF99_00990 [Bacteroidota bacterium]